MPLQQHLNDLDDGPPLFVTNNTNSNDKEKLLHISCSADKPTHHTPLVTNTNAALSTGTATPTNAIGTNRHNNSSNPVTMMTAADTKQPVAATAIITPPLLSSAVYLDNIIAEDDDQFTTNHTNTTGSSSSSNNKSPVTTIDMIQTLPTYSASAALSNNGDVYNKSLRCYISNMIMPSSSNCKSSCTVRGEPLSVVLHKINDFLRIQCIPFTIQYTPTTMVALRCERNSALSSLVGPSLVFVIHLWYQEQPPPPPPYETPDASSTVSTTTSCDNHPPILIDVQRRRGCPLDLQVLRRSLFRSLLNTECTSEYIGTRTGMIPLAICRSIRRMSSPSTSSSKTVHQNKVDDDEATLSTSTELPEDSEAMELLLYYQAMLDPTNSVEKNRMGLECLCQNIDKTVADVSKAKPVVEAIVDGPAQQRSGENGHAYHEMVEKFRANLLHFATSEDTPEVATSVLTTAGCSRINLRCLTFRAIYTSLELYLTAASKTEGSENKKVLSIENDPFWCKIINECQRAIGEASTAPCFATVSIVLIITLLSSTIVSVPSKEMIYNVLCPKRKCCRANGDLKNAHAWGQQHHAYLERYSQQLLDLFACECK
jgi:hypothetical protein